MLAKSVERQFLELYENLAEPLFRHCYFRLSDREKARDLMQESFTRTWERLVDGEKIKNLKAFVYRVANNLIIDIYRKKKESSLDLLQEDGFDPGSDDHEAILSMIAERELVEILGNLDDKYRQVIVMRYIDDLVPREIAGIVGETENTVSVRLHRGLHKVRDLIKLQENKNE